MTTQVIIKNLGPGELLFTMVEGDKDSKDISESTKITSQKIQPNEEIIYHIWGKRSFIINEVNGEMKNSS
jgi:hypothetical protein